MSVQYASCHCLIAVLHLCLWNISLIIYCTVWTCSGARVPGDIPRGWFTLYAVSQHRLGSQGGTLLCIFQSYSVCYLLAGNLVLWLRYAEWLLTCPVSSWSRYFRTPHMCCLQRLCGSTANLMCQCSTPVLNMCCWCSQYSNKQHGCCLDPQVILIHLSNLTGMKGDYNKRTMGLLVSDIGTIVFGCTAAMCTGYIKVCATKSHAFEYRVEKGALYHTVKYANKETA